MPGEQEQANEYFLRMSVKGGLKFCRFTYQVFQLSKSAIKNKLENQGGQKKYKALKKSNEPLKQIDISHVKDMDRFDALAKAHKIQYAITNDPNNPEKEFFWFKARNEDEINAFLVAVLDLGRELEQEVSDVEMDTPEELLNKKQKSEEIKEDTKYKFHEQSFEDHEYRVTDFEKFEDLKAYVAEKYDHKLKDLDVGINSFSEINDIKELEEIISKLDKNEVRVWIERDPILIFKEHKKEADTKESTYRTFEHSFETKETDINDFEDFVSLKMHLKDVYKEELDAAGITLHSFDKTQSIEELNVMLSKIDQSKISLKVEMNDSVRESISKEQHSAEPKFKLFETSSKSNEQKVVEFKSFNNLKNYLTENYQDNLKLSKLGVSSFKEITSTKEMNEVLSRLDKSGVHLKVERKPLTKEFSEKEKQAKEAKKQKDKVKVKEAAHER